MIGDLATERVRSDFNRELRSGASTLASNTQIIATPEGPPLVTSPELRDYSLANDATARVLDLDGAVIGSYPPRHYAPLGPVSSGITERGPLRVATAAVLDSGGTVVGYVQYARSEEDVNDTVSRLWLLIAAGVLGGSLLASLSGLAIASRAMRPSPH